MTQIETIFNKLYDQVSLSESESQVLFDAIIKGELILYY